MHDGDKYWRACKGSDWDYEEKYDKVQWKEAAGFRDIAAHKYQTLNMMDVYKTIKEDFPVFQKQLSAQTIQFSY